MFPHTVLDVFPQQSQEPELSSQGVTVNSTANVLSELSTVIKIGIDEREE
jgi:hypothetical protein